MKSSRYGFKSCILESFKKSNYFLSKIDEIWIPLPLENPRETCIAKGTPKVIKNDVEKPSIWRSSKNQLFDSHNDHYLDTSEPSKSQRMLYNTGYLKNVRLEEEKAQVC